MIKLKNTITSIVLVALCSSFAFGQDKMWKTYPYELIGGFGPSFMLGELGGGNGVGRNSILDLDFLSTRFGGCVGMRKTFRERVSWQTTFSIGMLSGNDNKTKEYFRSDRDLSFRTPIQELSFRLEYKIRKERGGHIYDLRGVRGQKGKKFSTYCFAGIGLYHFNPKAKIEGEWIALQPIGTEGQNYIETRRPYSLYQICIPLGLIAKYTINKRWAISAEAGLRFLFTDYLDDVSTTYANPDLVAAHDNTVTDAMAKLAADPAYVKHCYENGQYHYYNEQRGDPYDRDFYMFIMISAHYKMKQTKDGWPTFKK
ncbi:MAG: DUF6089 family protein [Bacteroidales bacterium]|nr:DUF6089 family protein [Bacteroidales bacterium]